MEELLKPDALERFSAITDAYTKFTRLQDSRLGDLANGEDTSDREEHGFQMLRDGQTEKVENVHFLTDKIESLVDRHHRFNGPHTNLGGQAWTRVGKDKGVWVMGDPGGPGQSKKNKE